MTEEKSALEINREGWDKLVAADNPWTRPVSSKEIARARSGDWALLLTPIKCVPREWLGDVEGRRIVCLASGGGQQGPILAAAGAEVAVADASQSQLNRDEMVARREGLELRTVRCFMHDLSAFADESFDLVFHPVSNCYAPEILPVWREAFRVLKPGGALLSGMTNPVLYIFDPEAEARGELKVRFRLPYADVTDLPAVELEKLVLKSHTMEFSQSLEDQIGGQLEAGFVLTHLYEDSDPASPAGRFFPVFFATRAVKPPM